MVDPLERLAAFGRALRDAGLSVGTGRIASFCRAAALLEPEELYWAGRATLVARRDDIDVYDKVFRTFFGRQEIAPRARARVHPRVERMALASRDEILRTKSFAECSPDELAQIARLMLRLRLAVPERRTRRRRPARAGGPDLRRTLRSSFRTGGEPLERAWRERRRRSRRLVLLLDVSGSMEPYSRALVLFAHAALRSDRRWEAFCFGTRLTRVTGALAAAAQPAEALKRASAEVSDWGGGTRIGESLERFLVGWGHRGLARGAVVVVCSDGLDVGDPEQLGEQMARLSRLAHRIVWLNPLRESPEYEPLARGMAAALPYVDVFSSGHNLAALEELGAELVSRS